MIHVIEVNAILISEREHPQLVVLPASLPPSLVFSVTHSLKCSLFSEGGSLSRVAQAENQLLTFYHLNIGRPFIQQSSKL